MRKAIDQWDIEHQNLIAQLTRACNAAATDKSIPVLQALRQAKEVLITHGKVHPAAVSMRAKHSAPRPEGQAPELSIDSDHDLEVVARMAGFETVFTNTQQRTEWAQRMRRFVRNAKAPPNDQAGPSAADTDTDTGAAWVSNIAEQAMRLEDMAGAMDGNNPARVELLATVCVMNDTHVQALRMLGRDRANIEQVNTLHERLEWASKAMANMKNLEATLLEKRKKTI